jgi:hypothetical protein
MGFDNRCWRFDGDGGLLLVMRSVARWKWNIHTSSCLNGYDGDGELTTRKKK